MVVRLYFKAVRSRSDLMMAQFRLMNVSYSSYPELQPAFQDYDKKLRANIVEHIDRARARGDVKTEADAHTFAITLMGMLRGVAMQSFVDPKAVDLDKAEQSTIDVLRRCYAHDNLQRWSDDYGCLLGLQRSDFGSNNFRVGAWLERPVPSPCDKQVTTYTKKWVLTMIRITSLICSQNF